MECLYFLDQRCRSCTLLEMSRDDQVERKMTHVRTLLDPLGVERWSSPFVGADQGFRNKAKMVVAGTLTAPTLGILDPNGGGIDLQGCGLHSPGLRATLPSLAAFITTAGLTPYVLASRRGELKHLLVTESPDGELMVRFVLRSTESLSRIRKHLPNLLASLPRLAVVSVNLQPAHRAVLEGAEEVVLHGETLTMRINGMPLHLRPQSFFQTNTPVAEELYREAREWCLLDGVHEVWDLYCGVGGFALHLAAPGRRVTGVEVSDEAVLSARTTAEHLGVTATFVAADASAWTLAQDHGPDLVVVNPPRRGIGPELSGWLESSEVKHVLYSSCNAESLARDLAHMPSWHITRARLLDMFPHTDHYEVLVLLTRAQNTADSGTDGASGGETGAETGGKIGGGSVA